MRFKFLFILFIILSGCQKPYERECWKSNGKYQITQVQQSSINEINLYDDINLILINDSLNYLSIETPKNLINSGAGGSREDAESYWRVGGFLGRRWDRLGQSSFYLVFSAPRQPVWGQLSYSTVLRSVFLPI